MHDYVEVVGNLHNHTPYSDGNAYHCDIAQAAEDARLDFVVVTDHNVWVDGVQGYYASNDQWRRVLLLTGEEIHDQARRPQVNHLLVYNAGVELAQYAWDPQLLIDAVTKYGGLCFLAHPCDPPAPVLGIGQIPWADWDVTGYTGLEVWNFMSDFKNVFTNRISALRAIFDPAAYVTGPTPAALAKWDALLATGARVVGIGNADAHGSAYGVGRFRRVVFPYELLYRAVNTHLLLEKPLSGDRDADATLIYEALGRGRGYIGYHLIGDPRGFRFTAVGQDGETTMGERALKASGGVTLQAAVPARATLRLIRHGKLLREIEKSTTISFVATEPGAYRVEAWLPYKGVERAWILSNPIYLK